MSSGLALSAGRANVSAGRLLLAFAASPASVSFCLVISACMYCCDNKWSTLSAFVVTTATC
eukprot:scaffold360078_cov33-Prasinocladus_malaysianus.AAC.1